MNPEEVFNLESKVYANTFRRLPVAVVRGKGMYCYGINGEEYLDLFSGIAVNALGHCHPKMIEELIRQSNKLIHTSNWTYTLPQLELAELLTKTTGLEKAFFSNSGSEAVETAVKLARKVTGKKEIIAAENAFHGRTMGSLSLTWSRKYREKFEPLVPGMKFVKYNDAKAVEDAIGEDTAAVILEPVQNEAGIIIPSKGYLKEVRKITEKKGVLLILDEAATGFGRTGKMFGFQHENIKPDILCLAKALGGGLPIGATLLRKGLDFEKGEHGSTFGGNPLVCATAKTVVEVIMEERLAENAGKVGRYLLDRLLYRNLKARGIGLMVGLDVEDGRETVLKLIEKNILTIYSGSTVRILPPLIMEEEHADRLLEALDEI